LEHKPKISDHRLLKVTIAAKNIEREKDTCREIKSKKHAEWASKIMLEKILEGRNVEDTIEAFK